MIFGQDGVMTVDGLREAIHQIIEDGRWSDDSTDNITDAVLAAFAHDVGAERDVRRAEVAILRAENDRLRSVLGGDP